MGREEKDVVCALSQFGKDCTKFLIFNVELPFPEISTDKNFPLHLRKCFYERSPLTTAIRSESFSSWDNHKGGIGTE